MSWRHLTEPLFTDGVVLRSKEACVLGGPAYKSWVLLAGSILLL